jgi:hypothetical protein
LAAGPVRAHSGRTTAIWEPSVPTERERAGLQVRV